MARNNDPHKNTWGGKNNTWGNRSRTPQNNTPQYDGGLSKFGAVVIGGCFLIVILNGGVKPLLDKLNGISDAKENIELTRDILNSGDAVEVTGKVDGLNWYEISLAGGKAYVSASLLQSTQPVQQPATSSSSSSTATTTPSTPSQPSTPSTPSNSTSGSGKIVAQDGTITIYENGDAEVGGVIYHEGEYIPGYGIRGGKHPGR